MDQIRANTPAPIKANLMTELLSVQMSWEMGLYACWLPGRPADARLRAMGRAALPGDDAGERVGPWWVKEFDFCHSLTNMLFRCENNLLPGYQIHFYQKTRKFMGIVVGRQLGYMCQTVVYQSFKEQCDLDVLRFRIIFVTLSSCVFLLNRINVLFCFLYKNVSLKMITTNSVLLFIASCLSNDKGLLRNSYF